MVVYIEHIPTEKMNHLYGKTKRFTTSLIFSVDVKRAGECRNCGACCIFLYKCPFLKFENNNSHKAICTVYSIRPPQCRKYPRTKREQIHQPCGYYFTDSNCQE